MTGTEQQSIETSIRDGVPSEWQQLVGEAWGVEQQAAIIAFLEEEANAGRTVFPPAQNIFQAFKDVAPKNVRVVIVGQDPYHGEGQAIGRSFAVRNGTPTPPSLLNIVKEVAAEFKTQPKILKDLSGWSEQGVLMLNTTLTVRAGVAASHSGHGWEAVTQAALDGLAREYENIVFMAWGRHAQRVCAGIDPTKHLLLKSAHPSPLSASKGFFGNNHFLAANRYLEQHGRPPINWAD